MFGVIPSSTGAPEIPLWLWLVATGGVGLLVGSPAWLPSLRQRRKHEQRRKAADDAVLGVEADRDYPGQPKKPGLVEIVASIDEAIGHRNGRPLMEHVKDINGRLAKLERERP